MTPPPYEPAFAGGQGLDLRGAGLIWAGFVATMSSVAVTTIGFGVLPAWERRRAWRRDHPAG